MLKLIQRILITLIVLTVLGFAVIVIYSSGRTFYNDDDEIGNTAGNILNGGLFCEKEGTIYFSNDKADGSLYAMNSDCTKIRLIHEDKAAYINVDENYIYYARANNTKEGGTDVFSMFYNSGIYRIKQNGNSLKAITSKPGAYLTLKGNNLYFQRYDVDEGLYLYRYNIDASNDLLLIKDAVIPALIDNDKLYYAGYQKDHKIHYKNLKSLTTNTLVEGNYSSLIFQGNYIYYIDLNDKYRIYRMRQDGSEPTLLVDERCSTYNVTNSGKYLYYQVDNGKKNRICRMNLETMESVTLMDGNYKQIHVTDYYVFFKDFDNTNTYLLFGDDKKPNISIFNPSVKTLKK